AVGIRVRVDIDHTRHAGLSLCDESREHEPQRHKDTKKCRKTVSICGVSLCPCVFVAHAFARTIPNPFALGLTPSMRTPFIKPCGVEETTGTLISFSSGTMRSSVFKAPQETTSASAFFEFAYASAPSLKRIS